MEHTVTFADRTQWITATTTTSAQSGLPLAQIVDCNGHAITFAYDNAGLLASITNEDNTALLTIHRVADGTGNIAWVQSYQELDRVS